jgi:membrane fusion protein, heavy metal efflux system
MRPTSIRQIMLLPVLAIVLTLAACGKPEPEKTATNPAQAASPDTPAKNATDGGTETGKDKDGDEHGTEGLLKLSSEDIGAAGIRIEELKAQLLTDRVVLTATIRANQDRIAHVAPRVSARIVKVNANLGDKVRQGQSLAQLDSIELGEAHSTYRQAQSQFLLAKSDFDRAQKLKVDEIIPEKDFLRARSEYEKARASLRTASDRLKLLDATHQESDTGSISLFPVKAPFAGTVIEKNAVLGELAQPDKSIFTIADLSTLWIEANLFEKDLGKVRIGAAASVTVNAYPGEAFQGRLTYISSTVDKESRTVQARVEVPNTDGRLKPEMFAIAVIDTASTSMAITLPQEAVLLINGQATAFVREASGFEARAVELGDKVGGADHRAQRSQGRRTDRCHGRLYTQGTDA